MFLRECYPLQPQTKQNVTMEQTSVFIMNKSIVVMSPPLARIRDSVLSLQEKKPLI